MHVRSVGTEPDEIDDLKDAERVDDEERDEPPLLSVSCGVPKSISFENNGPEYDDEEEWKKYKGSSRCKWGIKWREVVHIRELYHTLRTCDISAWIMAVRR